MVAEISTIREGISYILQLISRYDPPRLLHLTTASVQGSGIVATLPCMYCPAVTSGRCRCVVSPTCVVMRWTPPIPNTLVRTGGYAPCTHSAICNTVVVVRVPASGQTGCVYEFAGLILDSGTLQGCEHQFAQQTGSRIQPRDRRTVPGLRAR